MSQQRYMSVALIVAASFVIVLSASILMDESVDPSVVASAAWSQASDPRIIEIAQDLESRLFAPDGGLVNEFEIAYLSVRPRAFGFFNYHAVNELHVDQGRFDMYLSDEVPLDGIVAAVGGLGLRGSDTAKERSPVYGAITRVVIEGVILRFHVENQLVLQVTAERGVSNDRDELVLVDPLLARADGSRLVRTGRARWVPREHSFVLPGEFEIEYPGGVLRGTGAAVDMELEIL